MGGNVESLREWMSSQTDAPEEMLRQLAYTLSSRRSHFPVRTSWIASTPEEFLAAASNTVKKPIQIQTAKSRLTFILTGQGAQWFAMGRELLNTRSKFTESLHTSERLLNKLGVSWSLLEELSRDEHDSRINQSEIAQPSSTALQIALVDLLDSFGIRPNAVLGHSSGEIAAAYAAGALSHESAIQASFHRSRVAQLAKQSVGTRGGMLVTSLKEAQALNYIGKIGEGRLSLACVNSPSSTTISGDSDAVQELQKVLEEQSIMAKVLAVDIAYHSHHMRGVVASRYLELLEGLDARKPREDVQFFSSVTGQLKQSGFGAECWVQNIVSTVRFSDALLACSAQSSPARAGSQILLEVGPHSALAGPSKQTLASFPAKVAHSYFSALVRGKNAHFIVLTLAGQLFDYGVDIDIDAVNSLKGKRRNKIILDLPPYAWDYSNRFWHESRLSKEHRFRKHPYHDLLGLRLIGSTPLEPIWRNILSVDAQPWLSEHVIDGFASLPGSSFLTMAMEAARRLNEECGLPQISTFHMRNVHYFKAVPIPESPDKVELMISLSSSSSG